MKNLKMKNLSDSAKEQRSWSSVESSDNSSSNSSQIYGNDLAEAYKDDLYKNQWIPLAIITAFLLITAACVYLIGGEALRYAEPTKTPSISEAMPLPIQAPPTYTVTAIPTPTVPVPVSVVLRVLPSSANMRISPSTTARLIGQIKRGSLANPLFQSPDGRWFLVIGQENGITGWVASELFETVSGDTKTLPTVVLTGP